VRLNAEDRFLLSISQLRSGNLAGAFVAGQQAAALEPDRPDLQELLAELYRLAGDREKSDNHKGRADRLLNALPAIPGAPAIDLPPARDDKSIRNTQ
jgi:cytochrome c-type biogenesis protein CcmH/NrfG